MLQAPALQVPTLRFDIEYNLPQQVSAGSSLGEDAGNFGLQGGRLKLMDMPKFQFGEDNGGVGFLFYPVLSFFKQEAAETGACVEEPTEPEAGAKKTRDAKVKKGKKEKGMLCC